MRIAYFIVILLYAYFYGIGENAFAFAFIPIIGTADAWALHDKIKEYMGDGTVDLDGDTFKLGLYLSTSNVATTSIDGIAAATNEHAAANGYSAGGVTLTSITWVEAAGTVTFDGADAVFNASGGNIVARFAVIYDDTVTTPVADPIVCHGLLDNAPADVTAVDGNPLTIQMAGTGIFTSV